MMNIKITNSRSGVEESLQDNQYILEENQEYIVQDNTSSFTKDDFKSLGKYISPELGFLSSTNKIGVFKLRSLEIRFRSKLGDDFFTCVKNEIAEIEKFFLLSENSLEDNFGLSYGDFLEEIALSVFLKEWETGRVKSLLRIISENPNIGFINKPVSKNLYQGDFLSETDFQYLNNNLNQLAKLKDKVVPITFKSVIREKTYDVIEMRFIKFFLFYCSNLLERYLISHRNTVNDLIKKLESTKADSSREFSETKEAIKKNLDKQKKISAIKVTLNRYLKSEILKNVTFSGDLDFTSLKIHNNFQYKHILMLFLKMRKTFDVLSNPNMVRLDINSLENLYEYYCFIKVIKSFNVKPDQVRKIIVKDDFGWFIDKSKPLILGKFNDVELSLFFKRTFTSLTETFSQEYEPDLTIELKDNLGNLEFLHLDAKYKHNNMNVKKDDIDKMHTYTHAIKSTKASLVLYPGVKKVFYDCDLSTVGAIPCNPSVAEDFKSVILKLLNLN